MKSTVLIVDDEPAVTQALRRTLRKEPYDVVCSDSAEAALHILASRRVSVVVSDEQMPGMSGSEFLSIVCKKHPETVRIILTGQANLDAIIMSINQGEIYRFLTKPCNQDELVITIRQALEQRKLRLISRKVLKTMKRQSALLDELEAHCPGITQVTRDASGAIVLDDMHENLEALTRELTEELGEFGPSAV